MSVNYDKTKINVKGLITTSTSKRVHNSRYKRTTKDFSDKIPKRVNPKRTSQKE